MPDTESDQTLEIMQEMLHAERRQEITQTATVQGQTLALVIILRDLGVLSEKDTRKWEEYAQKMAVILTKITYSGEVQSSTSEEDPEGQLSALIEGTEAMVDLVTLLGTKQEDLVPLQEQLEKLRKMMRDIKDVP